MFPFDDITQMRVAQEATDIVAVKRKHRTSDELAKEIIRLRVLLSDVLYALNHVPNHDLPRRELAIGEGTNYIDTYALAATIQRNLKEV